MFNTEFLITALVVVLIPGTGVIYTVSNGLFLGRRASIAAAIGCTAGIIPHLAAGQVSQYVVHSPAVVARLRQAFAGIFAVLGLKLAVTD